MVYGPQWPVHRRVRDIVAALGDEPRSGLAYTDQARIAPALLRRVIAELGLPAREIAADPQLRGALCDWAQVAAPRLLLVLTGHFDLAIGAIVRHGDGSAYQQQRLADLDTGAALGVLALTELGGTNGANHRTVAEYDHATREFVLTTPSVESWKFMPNVADAAHRIAVVTARLLVDGADEGVLPFLVTLRDRTGAPPPGVRITTLPDKPSAPMDHALIQLSRVRVPREALLGGDWARIDDTGRFVCSVPVRRRFHASVGVLDDGRVDLANAAVAGARAALAGLIGYAAQRRPAGSTRLADRDSVRADIAAGLAAVYATGALGRRLRDMRADTTEPDPHRQLWPMLAKPLLAYTAVDILQTCRRRLGAQGALRSNHIVDWIGHLEGIVTAEGESHALWAVAGRSPHLPDLHLPRTPDQAPWYVDMLAERERRLADGHDGGSSDPDVAGLGPESIAIERARATGERLAATALLTDARTLADPTARRLAAAAAAAYGLDRVHHAAAWFTGHPDMPRVAPALHQHRRVLADHMSILADAFAIPALSGPVYSPDYLHAYADVHAPTPQREHDS
jgi:acyl-CoA oxidase